MREAQLKSSHTTEKSQYIQYYCTIKQVKHTKNRIMEVKSNKFATKAIHGGQSPDSATGAIMTPIYQTSTYIQNGVGNHKGYEYSRTLNPTRDALEKNIAVIENGNFGACFGSGLAAIDAVLKMLNPGDEVISTNDIYGGSYRLFKTIFEKYGIVFHFVSMSDSSKVSALINKNTKLIWVETPTNPMLNIIDIAALAAISKKTSTITGCRQYFCHPVFTTTIGFGCGYRNAFGH